MIEALLGRERRLIAEQNVEELESLDVAAEHREDGHGHGEQPERPHSQVHVGDHLPLCSS